MTCKRGWIAKWVWVGLVLGAGCVSGTIRNVQIKNELPDDLPKELIERFEILEHSSLEASHPNSQAISQAAPVQRDSMSSRHKPKPKKGEKKNDKKKPSGKSAEETALKKDAATVPTEPPFVYPTRRPKKDPIWISERFAYNISYFGVPAGDFVFESLPFKTIDKRKVYHIRGTAISSSIFSVFYRLNDVVESFIDFEGIFSHRFHLVLDESKQERDSLELYDSRKKQTFFWNRWNHKVNGYKEVKEFSPLESFSQDSISALYFLRTLKLEPGMTVSVPVVSEGKGFEAICTVERREMMNTPLGKVQTLVIKPEMKYQGILKKSGDSYLWLTDDDRKMPVRLEAKVRIGTVVASLKKVELGIPPAPDSSGHDPEPDKKP